MIRSASLDTPHQITFSNGSQKSVADLPREKGGDGDGFGPHELVEAALATCMAMSARMSAAKHGYPLAGVECDVRVDRSVPGSVTFEYTLAFDGPLTGEQVRHLREVAAACPVGRTLTGPIALKPVEPL